MPIQCNSLIPQNYATIKGINKVYIDEDKLSDILKKPIPDNEALDFVKTELKGALYIDTSFTKEELLKKYKQLKIYATGQVEYVPEVLPEINDKELEIKDIDRKNIKPPSIGITI